MIWGELVPYDKVWRTGANAVTKITFDGDVMVEGQKLAAGSYGLFTIPGKTEWTIIFNKQSTGGPDDYSADKDVLRVKVKPVPTEMRELFTFLFPWSRPIRPSSRSAGRSSPWASGSSWTRTGQFLAKAKEAIAKAKPDDWQTPLTAARYLYDNKYALDDAAKWLDKSIATKETFGNLSTKANVLAADGKKKEAVATAEKALAAGAAGRRAEAVARGGRGPGEEDRGVEEVGATSSGSP